MGEFEQQKIAQLERELELYKTSNKTLAFRVDPAKFCRRLTAFGWKEVDSKRKDVFVFQWFENGQLLYQADVPGNGLFADFIPAMIRAAEEFALFLHQETKQVLVNLVLDSS